MLIGVSGASGQLGKQIMAEIESRERPHAFVGISRTPESVMFQAEARYGNYDEPESLAKAYRGLDRLLIIPSPVVSPGVLSRHLKAAIDSAVSADVGHIVLISSVASKMNAEPDIFSGFFEGEQHLMKTAPPWTILRMNFFAETFVQLVSLAMVGKNFPSFGENCVAFVSRDDLAAAAASILLGKGHSGFIYNATGPTAISVRERVRLLSEAIGESLHIAGMDAPSFRKSLLAAGIPSGYVNPMMDLERRVVAGNFDIVTDDIEHLSGRKPRSLHEIMVRLLA